MSKRIYTVVDRTTKQLMGEPTFERNIARSHKQVLKQQGLDPIILQTKLDKTQANIIR